MIAPAPFRCTDPGVHDMLEPRVCCVHFRWEWWCAGELVAYLNANQPRETFKLWYSLTVDGFAR